MVEQSSETIVDAVLPPGYKIRQATISDVAVLARHRAAMFVDAMGISKEQASAVESSNFPHISEAVSAGEFLAWLIEKEGEIAGSGGMIFHRIWPSPQHANGGREAHIVDVYTEPAHRRMGLAQKLLAVMIDWCRCEGIQRASLHATDAGKELYAKFGFTPTTQMRVHITE